MKRHHEHGKHFIGVGLQFRGLVLYFHGRKHGSMMADIMQEKKMRVLHMDRQEVNVTLDLA